ncbi:MAG: riboflavin synthase [Flavobacteriales bacterium]
MFSGIVECMGEVMELRKEGSNLHITLRAPFAHELKIDQSIAHNGACLTVVAIDGDQYRVTAIDETLQKTNLGRLKTGDKVNLERCTRLGDRLDGHIVQGHVDTTAICTSRKDLDGSWIFHFTYEKSPEHITVHKGSICINGVSLTVVDSTKDSFSVHIIPYTLENTVFQYMQPGDLVNLEFDIIGKYVARLMAQ